MPLNKLLSRLSLKYKEPEEEVEYNETKTPLIQKFFRYIFLALTSVLIPYAVRYFEKDLEPQKYIIIGLILFASIFFVATRNFKKYMEHFLLFYMFIILSLFTTVFRELIPGQDTREGFYMGYCFAMVHRLIGYQIINIKFMILLFVFSISLKFPMIPNPDLTLNIIVVFLDCLTVILGIKSEQSQRALFDSLYKSKKDILKFKHLLTEYLPNQIAIFSKEYTQTYYINNTFKRSFKCQDLSEAKECVDKFVIEKEIIEKYKPFLKEINSLPQNNQPLTLSHFLKCLTQKMQKLREIGMITFPVTESLKYDIQKGDDPQLKQDLLEYVSFDSTKNLKKSVDFKKADDPFLLDGNESQGSREKGNSHSSDFMLEGISRVFKVKIFPLLWDDTEAIAIIFDDITQQKVIMELKIADKNKDLVIAMVSHELRTPLNGMLGLLDIAKKNIHQSDVLSYLDACRNNGILLLNLINSILDINQIKKKKLLLINTKISVKDVLDEIRALFEYFCLIKNLYLNIEVDPKVPKFIITDKNRFTQILVNLIGNAFKFTVKGGITVKVDLESSRPYKIKVSVEDTGIGIQKEDQEKLFKMYGKVDHEDKRINTQGIGLGLTISNTLAMLLDFQDKRPIQVESEVGKGTRFTFVVHSQNFDSSPNQELDEALPTDLGSSTLNEDKDETIQKRMSFYISTKENLTKLPTFTKQNLNTEVCVDSIVESKIGNASSIKELKLIGNEKVRKKSPWNFNQDNRTMEIQVSKEEEETQQWCLIVDDNPFNLMVACHIMQERGYQVKTALNGKEAIERAIDHRNEGRIFKVVLMDCQMPIMDGYEATRRLKLMMKNREIEEYPIIALTANNRDKEHDKLCEEVGMSGHVSKPLHIEELETILRKINRPKN